jgi:hypothetical protein
VTSDLARPTSRAGRNFVASVRPRLDRRSARHQYAVSRVAFNPDKKFLGLNSRNVCFVAGYRRCDEGL